jgi:HEAT repeat protein
MADAANMKLNRLVADLGSDSAVVRRDARSALVEIGSAAVPRLLDELDAPKQHVRWEAAKTLAEIADPSAAERLVTALADKDSDVRWVVGAALIALGRAAVRPLLAALTQSDLPDSVYSGAHHVLHDLARHDALASQLKPVLEAFKEPEPPVAVPLAAAAALKDM